MVLTGVLVGGVVGAGCVSGSYPVADVDFVGEVVSVDAPEWSAVSDNGVGGSSGGPASRIRVGPATFHLADGTALTVAAGTTGGNMCRLVGYRDRPETPTCLVTGELDGAGQVAWFAIQPLEKLSDGSTQLTVDRFDGRTAIVLIGGTRVAVPIRVDATLNCSEPGDLASDPVKVPSSSSLARLNGAGEVIAVECLYGE